MGRSYAKRICTNDVQRRFIIKKVAISRNLFKDFTMSIISWGRRKLLLIQHS